MKCYFCQSLRDLRASFSSAGLRGEESVGPRAQPLPHRALDILHVAAAVHLGADEFLTFDFNQRKLALAAGLKPGP